MLATKLAPSSAHRYLFPEQGNGMVFAMTSVFSEITHAPDLAPAEGLIDPFGPGRNAVRALPAHPLVQQEIDWVSSAGTTQVNHARVLLDTAQRWADQGRVPEALPLVESATGIYRRLALVEPETYLPDLARALTNVATLRSYTSWGSAVAPAEEATRICRHLTRARADAIPDVAGSLSSLLTFLWEMAAASRCQIPDAQNAGRV